MVNPPTQKQLNKIPPLYSTEDTPLPDKMIHMHFFLAKNDWYIAEYDKENRLFFGFTILNGDTDMAEWGYISYDEMLSLRAMGGLLRIEREYAKYWKIRPAREIDRIMQCRCMQHYIEKEKDAECLTEVFCERCKTSFSLPASEKNEDKHICSECFNSGHELMDDEIILLTEAVA